VVVGTWGNRLSWLYSGKCEISTKSEGVWYCREKSFFKYVWETCHLIGLAFVRGGSGGGGASVWWVGVFGVGDGKL